MKKIMFNDRYRLTAAVLAGQKTQTRRIVTERQLRDILQIKIEGVFTFDEMIEICISDSLAVALFAPYPIYEEVAIAQNYNEIIQEVFDKGGLFKGSCAIFKEKGLSNKMFVRAELMPHRIRITGVKLERLQDISDEDCLKEGVIAYDDAFGKGYMLNDVYNNNYRRRCFTSARKAFSFLIDKISGKGTWENNPFVLVYDFVLL